MTTLDKTGREEIAGLRRGIRTLVRAGVSYHAAIEEFRRQYILAAIDEAEGNRCEAARRIGLHRNRIVDHVGTKAESALLKKRPSSSNGSEQNSAAAPTRTEIGGFAC